MNICGGKGRDSHEEVCFEGHDCPMCAMQREVEGLNEQIEKLESELK